MWHGNWRGWHMIIQSVEKYASWRKILRFLRIGHHDRQSQVLHPQDWMPEHYIFFPSFTTELILSHPRKMLIPWKRNHSKSSRKNSSNKGLKSLVQPHKWSSWDVTEQRICLETIPPRLAGLLLPCQIPSITATLDQEGKIVHVLTVSCCTQARKNTTSSLQVSHYIRLLFKTNLHIVICIPITSPNFTNQW